MNDATDLVQQLHRIITEKEQETTRSLKEKEDEMKKLVLEKYNAMAEAVEKERELEEKNKIIQEKEIVIAELMQENEKLKNYQREYSIKIAKLEQELLDSKAEINQISKQLMGLQENQLAGQKENSSQFNKKIAKKKNEINESTEKNVAEIEEFTSVLIMESSDTIYLLNSDADCWKKLRITLPIPMRDFGAALVNNEIYIFGGYSTPNYQQNCYKLKFDGTWMELASLNEKRGFISNSSVVYLGEIWIIGGYSGYQNLKSVEKYNIPQKKWIQMPDLNESRSDAAAAVYKNKIIVTGGWGFENSVELFDPELQKWILFCDLPIDVYNNCLLPIDVRYHCMTISDSILTIYGGYSGYSNDATESVWEMDIEDPQKKWTKKQNLKYARYQFGIAKLSNRIIAIGGYGIDTTEIFDGENWIEGPKLPQNLSHFAYTAIPHSFEENLLKKFS